MNDDALLTMAPVEGQMQEMIIILGRAFIEAYESRKHQLDLRVAGVCVHGGQVLRERHLLIDQY